MRRSLTLVFLLAGVFAFVQRLSLWAEPAGGGDFLDLALIEDVKLYLGETKVFKAQMPQRVAVGNPLIADVSDVTDEAIIVIPKSQGETSLTFADKLGEHTYKLRILSEDLSDDLAKINAVLKELNQPRVFARLVDTEDKIVLKGQVESQEEKEVILAALGALKDKAADLIKIKEKEETIDIDVQVVEIDKDATNTLGFTMPGSIDLIEKGSQGISDAGAKWSTLFKVLNLQRGTSSGTSPFTFKLDALIQEGKARIISRPRLACQSGKEAELLVGGEKPILTTEVAATSGSSGTRVTYKEYGIKLNIKPTVTEKERIKVSVNVEVSDVGEAETLGTATETKAKAFPLIKRTASTELFLDSGQTLLIGGLTKEKEDVSVRKTAFLGDVPVLGMFFRKKTTKLGGGAGEKGNVELVILITPKVIALSKEKSAPAQADKAAPQAPSVNLGRVAKKAKPNLSYADTIREYIARNFVYPSFAKEYSFHGTVKLRLHLSSEGELLDVSVKESSGHKALDSYALSAVQNLSSFPAFPASIEATDLFIDIPIVYKLD